MRLEAAASALSEEEQARFLEARGWVRARPKRVLRHVAGSPLLAPKRVVKAEWTHPCLFDRWPQSYALQLELEEPRSVSERGGVS